jgi:hypothetical protein
MPTYDEPPRITVSKDVQEPSDLVTADRIVEALQCPELSGCTIVVDRYLAAR